MTMMTTPSLSLGTAYRCGGITMGESHHHHGATMQISRKLFKLSINTFQSALACLLAGWRTTCPATRTVSHVFRYLRAWDDTRMLCKWNIRRQTMTTGASSVKRAAVKTRCGRNGADDPCNYNHMDARLHSVAWVFPGECFGNEEKSRSWFMD